MPISGKSGLFSALGRLAAGLAGLLAIELYFTLRPLDNLQPLNNPTAQTASENREASGKPSQSVLSAQRGILLDRPVFNPSRRPFATHYAQAMPAQIPRLSGIMITPDEKIAVFSPAGGRPIIVAQNSRLGAFTVVSIMRDSVTVNGPNGVIVLRSNFIAEGPPIKSTPGNPILPGGIDLSQINVTLPTAATWVGPPDAN